MTHVQHRIAGRTTMAIVHSLSVFTISSVVGGRGPGGGGRKLRVEVDNVIFY